MTSKLKCPFCGGELDTENYYVHCHNPHCSTTVEMEGTEEMWQALIQVKQDLKTATKALENIVSDYEVDASNGWLAANAKKALEQIKKLCPEDGEPVILKKDYPWRD